MLNNGRRLTRNLVARSSASPSRRFGKNTPKKLTYPERAMEVESISIRIKGEPVSPRFVFLLHFQRSKRNETKLRCRQRSNRRIQMENGGHIEVKSISYASPRS